MILTVVRRRRGDVGGDVGGLVLLQVDVGLLDADDGLVQQAERFLHVLRLHLRERGHRSKQASEVEATKITQITTTAQNSQTAVTTVKLSNQLVTPSRIQL